MIHFIIVFNKSLCIICLQKKKRFKEKGNTCNIPKHTTLFLFFFNLHALSFSSLHNLVLFFFITLPKQKPTLPPCSFTVSCCRLGRDASMFVFCWLRCRQRSWVFTPEKLMLQLCFLACRGYNFKTSTQFWERESVSIHSKCFYSCIYPFLNLYSNQLLFTLGIDNLFPKLWVKQSCSFTLK